MGAGQSQRQSQSGGSSPSSASGKRRLHKSNGAASLRRSMGQVLWPMGAAGRRQAKLSSGADPAVAPREMDSAGYCVAGATAVNQSNSMNNYVTMHQHQHEAGARLQQQQLATANVAFDGTLYGTDCTDPDLTTHQNHHHRRPLQHQLQHQLEHQLEHQLKRPQAFQLAQAVNTKTSSVLGNTRGGSGVAMPRTTSALNANKANYLPTTAAAQSGACMGALTGVAAAVLGCDNENSENVNHQQQYYARNLLADYEQLAPTADFVVGVAGYKQPQQQYLGPRAYEQQPQLDFHQPHQLILDCHNYQRSHSFASATPKVPQSDWLGSGHQATNQKSPKSSKRRQQHWNTISASGHRRNKSLVSVFGLTSSPALATSSQQQQRLASSSSLKLKRIKSQPLSAQQATYEAMRTIDMYLIKQIAHSCMDFEMEQKIDLEIRLRELAAQSMLEAHTEIDVLEVEKSLLTSDQRMNCYASQLEQQRKQLSTPSLSTDSGRGSKNGGGGHRRQRSDVIGASSPTTTVPTNTSTGTGGGHDTSSPSFSSLSTSQSPSKLSPVSGESANSPASFTSCSRHNSRYRQGSNNNTLNARQRAKQKRRQQLLQTITSLSNINCNMVLNNRASISLSEIRIPLMWRHVDHFKGRGDYKRFAVFCLLRIDSQIYDTQLISDVDRQTTDVTFSDVVVFQQIKHNFELTLEVYSCVYLEQYSLSSTPRKLKEKLTNSVSRAMGKRLATQTASINYTKELQAYDKSYRFAMIASANLRLEDASDGVKTYDLVLVSPSAHHRQQQLSTNAMYSSNQDNNNYQSFISGQNMTSSNSKEANKNTLPLFGHFCCRLFVKPDVFDKNVKSGYLRVAIISVPNQPLPTSQHQRDQNSTLASSGLGSGSSNNSSSGGSRHHSPPIDQQYLHQNTTDSSIASKLRATKMATLSMSSSTIYWALLRNFSLHLWAVDEQRLNAALARGQLPQLENPRRPNLSVNIDRYTRLLRVSNSSITLETDKSCFVLGVYSHEQLLNQPASDEIGLWLRAIEQLIYDSHIWGSVLNHYPAHTKR